jgi:dsDNA-specific endonuclease/ATPase MutS2
VPTTLNTLDLRGARAAEAAALVADFLGRTGDEGDAVFIITGLGPLKRAVRDALKGVRGVASVGDAPGGEAGVTMVRVGPR